MHYCDDIVVQADECGIFEYIEQLQLVGDQKISFTAKQISDEYLKYLIRRKKANDTKVYHD